MLPVTRVFLDLVADVWAFRWRSRFVRGWLGALPGFRHRKDDLNDHWQVLRSKVVNLLTSYEERISVEGEHDSRALAAVKDVAAELSEMDAEVELVNQAQKAIDAIGDKVIPDLGSYLSMLADAWESRHKRLKVDRQWDAVYGFSLQCDPLIFKETLWTLVSNALDAAPLDRFDTIVVLISASLIPCQSARVSQILEIEVTDSGPGIPADIAHAIFIDGLSFHPDGEDAVSAKHSGRGLSVARAQLLLYHGSLDLKHTTETTASNLADERLPGSFMLRFGIFRESLSTIRGRHGDDYVTHGG
jgi:signal transduction histidine kinase